jgi:hypothetical protein
MMKWQVDEMTKHHRKISKRDLEKKISGFIFDKRERKKLILPLPISMHAANCNGYGTSNSPTFFPLKVWVIKCLCNLGPAQ